MNYNVKEAEFEINRLRKASHEKDGKINALEAELLVIKNNSRNAGAKAIRKAVRAVVNVTLANDPSAWAEGFMDCTTELLKQADMLEAKNG